MRKKITLFLVFILASISVFSYEDYYQKMYVVKISENNVFKKINATKEQEKKLSKLFSNYLEKSKNIDNEVIKFDDKLLKIEKLENDKIKDISNILTEEQLNKYNDYVNKEKIKFVEKNNKIKDFVDRIGLTNKQKNDILMIEREFKRNFETLKKDKITSIEFIEKYKLLKKERNEKIKNILTEEQIMKLETFSI